MSFSPKPLNPKVMGLGDNRELFESSYEIVKRIFHIPYEHYKQLYEETLNREEMAKSPILRNFECAVSYGFTGTFEEYKKKWDSEPRGATGPTGGPGQVGIAVGKESVESALKKLQISELYEQAVSEGWYKGTIEEFEEFKKRCSWNKKRRPTNPNRSCSLLMVQTLPSEDSLMAQYNGLVEMYYCGTFDDFKYFMSEYDFGFRGGIGDRGVIP